MNVRSAPYLPIIAINAAVLALVAAACSGSSEGRARASVPAGPRTTGSGEIVLPIDSYTFKLSEVHQMRLARDLLAGRCMIRFGYTFDAAALTETSRKTAEYDIQDHGEYGNKRRYGSPTLAHATRYGFRMPSQVDGTGLALPRTKEELKRDVGGLGHLTPAKELVLTGSSSDDKKPGTVNGQQVPDGGCRGEADREMNGAIGEAPLVAQISRESFQRSLTDPALSTVFARWSTCVTAKGYNWPTPREAGAGFGDDNASPGGPRVTPSRPEVAAARANFRCQQQTNLIAVWSGFEAKYQKAQIDRNIGELEKIRKAQQRRKRYAAEIIAKRQ